MLFDSVFCEQTAIIGVKPSKFGKTSAEWRLSLWRLVDNFLRERFTDGADIVPAVDANTETLNVVDKKRGLVLPAFKLVPLVGDHLFCDHLFCERKLFSQ